ncbi:MAG: DUF3782 domain-containing protein [Spirochaetaceae bacterium]|nr:DUF3782 domain-containing protein [Spirochaetaceae bacterium]
MPELQNEPLTFEKVWAMFQETDRQFKETRKQMKETDRKIGELGNRFGELAEHLVLPGILEKFSNIGLDFTKNSHDILFSDPETRRALVEIDILLENDDIVIAIEVKSKLDNKDVSKHIARMEVLRQIADSKNDKRKYFGTVAGAIMTSETRSYAIDSGFYVIEQSGDTMKLSIPDNFIPREW